MKLARVTGLATVLFCSARIMGADFVTPDDVVILPENAAQETLNLSAKERSLRFLGLDLFPHASVTVNYDDNLLISHTDELHDVHWVLAPGLLLTAGDVSAYLPQSVTIDQLRGLMTYSLVEDTSKPQRFIAVDGTPIFNMYTKYDEYDAIDYSARFSGGYAFSRLALALDQDCIRFTGKNSGAGGLLTTDSYTTRLRTRYDVNDRTSFEVNGQYVKFNYEDSAYQGYDEFRNENWFNRQVGSKLNLGVGGTFGWLFPDGSGDQTFQQALLRGIYRVTGKMDVRLSGGVEFREYESGLSTGINPVFSLAGIYQPTVSTTVTLEAHRREEASPFQDYNDSVLGFYAGVRQQILSRIYAGLVLGFDNVEYQQTQPDLPIDRTDNVISAQVNLEYELNRHWRTTLFYIYRQDDSSQSLFSYSNNLVGLQVAWQF